MQCLMFGKQSSLSPAARANLAVLHPMCYNNRPVRPEQSGGPNREGRGWSMKDEELTMEARTKWRTKQGGRGWSMKDEELTMGARTKWWTKQGGRGWSMKDEELTMEAKTKWRTKQGGEGGDQWRMRRLLWRPELSGEPNREGRRVINEGWGAYYGGQNQVENKTGRGREVINEGWGGYQGDTGQ